MSDPVQNPEVEDVLSSIRRLVSEDKRPLQAPKIERPAPEPEADSDRLVLTPALRVGEESADQDQGNVAESAPRTRPAPRRETFADLVTDDALLDVYPYEEKSASAEPEMPAEPEKPQSRAEEIAEDYSTDPYNFDQDESDDDTEVSAEAETVDMPEARDHDMLRLNEAAPEAEDAALADVSDNLSDDHAAEVDDKVAEVADNVAYPEDSAAQTENLEGQADSPAPQAADAGKPTDARDQAGNDAETAKADQPAPTHGLSAKIAALETAISHISDRWEPDDPGESDYAGTEPETMAWEDDEPEEGTGRATFVRSAAAGARKNLTEAITDVSDDADADEPEPKPVFMHKSEHLKTSAPEAAEDDIDESPAQRSEAPEPAARNDTAPSEAAPAPQTPAEDNGLTFDEDDQFIDEDALRDLVSEIVREELQGALGERITRNVRKLVRREIHRALTAQELE